MTRKGDAPGKETPLLTVLMPCFNERDTVQEIVTRVLAVPIHLELIVVDDGSTDGTRRILDEFASEDRVRLLFHARNRGKGAARRLIFFFSRLNPCGPP